MSQPTRVILNPASRNGRTGARWQAIEQRVREVLGTIDVVTTRGPRDAVRIARESALEGARRLLVAGGDGTTGEVVTGVLEAKAGENCELGLLPLGTGGDLTRSLGVPRELDAALRLIAEGRTRCVDAGRVQYTTPRGDPAEVNFLNVASLGMSGLVTKLVNEAPKALGAASFLFGTLRALARWQSRHVRLRVDGEPFFEGKLHLATAANGRYFGGGMRVARDAELDDGLLDVAVISDLSKLALLRRLPNLYGGSYLDDPAVVSRRGRVLEAEAAPGEVPTEIDGEPLGNLPARYEILPSAITLVGVSG